MPNEAKISEAKLHKELAFSAQTNTANVQKLN